MTFHKISEVVYVGLCLKIGTSQQVTWRRQVVDIREFLSNEGERSENTAKMKTGSQREGFRLDESDVDHMFWPTDHRVLWDFSNPNSQVTVYDTHSYKLIRSDTSESPPGFTLLLPMDPERGAIFVLFACVGMNGNLYISSTKYRDITGIIAPPDSIQHGPCSSGTIGSLEYDYAHGFVSDFWPPAASSWIDRCHSWPPPHFVNEIVRSGCHLVPIGHRLGNHADNEWRISFSQAEQKLVYAMNHTQFLTYGLLKLFEKEINKGLSDNEKLLCSYHMKTAIFWTIQQDTIAHWCPQNLLADEHSLISEALLDNDFFNEINFNNALSKPHILPRCMKHLQVVEQLIRSPLTNSQIIMLQKLTATILQSSAFILHKKCDFTSGVNRHMNIAYTRSLCMLKLAAKFGYVSDLLYIAMYYYKMFRYREAILVIKMTKVKLAEPGLMYNRNIDPDLYTEAVGGKSWSTKMRQAVAQDIILNNNICYINELILEQQYSSQNNWPSLFIPPFVMLHMLEFLCYRHVDPLRAQAALADLQALLQHDKGVFVPVELRDISWEILGICQQMTRNYHAALYSYLNSLTQIPKQSIEIATEHRIKKLYSQLPV
ncbi:uncharacterized protein LOC144617557 [Crassostrea virginica]